MYYRLHSVGRAMKSGSVSDGRVGRVCTKIKRQWIVIVRIKG